MKSALFLIAGRGSRLGKLTKHAPKPLIKVNNKSILVNFLEILQKNGFREISFVTGYLGGSIYKSIGSVFGGMKINYLVNRDWEKYNNLYSLWLGKEILLKSDTLIIEGDIFIEEEALEKIKNCKFENYVVVSPLKRGMDGAKVIIDNKNNVVDWYIEKGESNNSVKDIFKSVGIFNASKSFSEKYLIPSLLKEIRNVNENKNKYYDEVLSSIAKNYPGLIKALNIKDTKWMEIDTQSDLAKAQQIFRKSWKKR